MDICWFVVFSHLKESELLREWAHEVHDLPCTPDVPWMPYQEVNVEGKRVLCRTENFANSHAGFDSFLRGQRATSVLQQLAGEEMFLFKEKINYKLAGSGGFDPHIDANVYTHVKNIKHLTILAAVDNINAANGGLEVVSGSHRLNIPLGGDRCIASDWVESNVWTPAELDSDDCDDLIIAALLHDIGQIIPLEISKEARMNLRDSTENVGRVGHDAIGRPFPRNLAL
ncbi:Phytanoyl-CoA dioxygenase [Penicillium cf. griseofulvum]|nr:Phytanoyl-CoA dioxygenase [Penicillium cf. griseofulvum]